MTLGWIWCCLVLPLSCTQVAAFVATIPTSVRRAPTSLLVALEDKEPQAEQEGTAPSSSSVCESVPIQLAFASGASPLRYSTPVSDRREQTASGCQRCLGALLLLPSVPAACRCLRGRSRAAWLSCSSVACRGVTKNSEAVLCLAGSLPCLAVAEGLHSVGFVPLLSPGRCCHTAFRSYTLATAS